MKQKIEKIISAVIDKKWPEAGMKKNEIEIGYPPEGLGEYTSSVAMKLSSKLKKNPFEIAEEIRKEILKNSENIFEKIEIARPGFVNFFLDRKVLVENILKINKEKSEYGSCQEGKNKKVMIEFGQPNTHKAFHVGHLRSAISGLSVAKIHKALGYEVIQANYYGDIGMHVSKAVWAMRKNGVPNDFEKWGVHERMELIDKAYVLGSQSFSNDEKAEKEIRQVNKNIYEKNGEDYELYVKLRDWSLEHLNDIFKKLGIEYDRQYPESEIYERALEIVKENEGKIFEKSQGAIIYRGEKEGLNNWVFLTKEGNPTYSAKDLALAEKKFSEYELDFSIVTTSIEQTDYFRAIIRCLEKINPSLKGRYKHIPFGWLLRGNKKTSSRMGQTAKGLDVIKEIEEVALSKIISENGYDEKTQKEITQKTAMAGLKFLILSHEFQGNINYDPNEFIKLKGFSGPFILYSFVRTQAILRKVKKEIEEQKSDNIELETVQEQDLARKLLFFPEIVLRAGQEISPHLICNYLYETAQKLNAFYEKCPIQKAQTRAEKNSRLILVQAVGNVLKNGLNLLGIETTQRM